MFDHSDFEVSHAQIDQMVKSTPTNLAAELDMIRYFIANVNYAGRLQRTDDQHLLNAMVADLFNSKLLSCTEQEADPSCSHYGFPRDQIDFYAWINTSQPSEDNYEIFGLNFWIESLLLKKEMFGILEDIYNLCVGA